MEEIRCPLNFCLDENLPLFTIFDTLSMKNDIANAVSCIFVYIINNKNSRASEIIINIIKANLGNDNFNLIKEYYIDTYNYETKKIKRYFYLSNPNQIYQIMDSFNIIYSLIPVLQKVASYYKCLEKERNS